MFILRPIRLLSSDSSCSICFSSCGVSVHGNMSSAKRRLERNSPSIFTPLFSQFNLLNMLSNVAVNSLGEMVSPCLTHLLILIFSLSLCRCTVTELSVCLSGFLCTHHIYLYIYIYYGVGTGGGGDRPPPSFHSGGLTYLSAPHFFRTSVAKKC